MLHDVLGHVAELDVALLRAPAQGRESVVDVEAVALHQDALRHADRMPRADRLGQRVLRACGGEGERGVLAEQVRGVGRRLLEAAGGRRDAAAPELGGYLTYQVPLVDIAVLTGLDLGPLPAADRLEVSGAPRGADDLQPGSAVVGRRWRLLRHRHRHEMVL